MDEKKAYGTLLAIGKAIGEEAREDPGLIQALRDLPDRDALDAFVTAHHGRVPDALAEEWMGTITSENFRREKARLIVQAKMVMKGEKPLGPQHGKGGGFKTG